LLMMDYREVKTKHIEFEEAGANAFYKRALKTVQIGDEAAKAVGILSFLLYWNRAWYRYRGKNLDSHIEEIEKAVKVINKLASNVPFKNLLEAQIDAPQIQWFVREAFSIFDLVCGETGASKALHLLYPDFFVMWDDKIRKAFHVSPDEEGYLAFLGKSKGDLSDIVESFSESEKERIPFEEAYKRLEQSFGVSLPKALDEFNHRTTRNK